MFKVGDKVRKVNGDSFADGNREAVIKSIHPCVDKTYINFIGFTGWRTESELELVDDREDEQEYVYLIIGTYSDGPDSLIGAFSDHKQADDVLDMIKRCEPMFNVRKEAVKLR